MFILEEQMATFFDIFVLSTELYELLIATN
jgi:hypothetical protein